MIFRANPFLTATSVRRVVLSGCNRVAPARPSSVMPTRDMYHVDDVHEVFFSTQAEPVADIRADNLLLGFLSLFDNACLHNRVYCL